MDIEIANRLYEYRKANGYSQEELASKIGVSRQAISKWERSESSPDTDNLIALAKLYNVSLDEMITGSSAPAKVSAVPEKEPVAEAKPEEQAPLKDSVNISMRGLDVQSKDGDRVHIGLDGINVNQGDAQQYNSNHVFTENSTKKAPWVSALLWLGGLILFLLIGAIFPSGWSVSWIILLLIPAIDTGVDAIIENKAQKFAYPLLATALFCALGMGFGLWHPAWILFLTIPIYYIIVNNIKKPDGASKERSSLFITFVIIFALAISSTLGIVCHTALQGRNSKQESQISSIGSMFNYENADAYLVGGASVPAAEVNALSVDWVNGSVTVSPAANGSNEITFSESKADNEDLKLHYMVDDGKLKIQFCKSHISIKSLKDFKKDLVITVPEKVFNSLEIDSVNAALNISSVDVSKLEIDNVSGKITATGAFNEVDIDNVSGNAQISNSAANSKFDIDTVSGDFILGLPKNTSGFAVKYDSVSGDINATGFNAAKDAKAKTLTYGDSAVNIKFDTVSGDLNITAQ